MTEAAYIIEEPSGCNGSSTIMVVRGRELRLTCRAFGLPPPTYQWCHENEKLAGKTDPLLIINNFE